MLFNGSSLIAPRLIVINWWNLVTTCQHSSLGHYFFCLFSQKWVNFLGLGQKILFISNSHYWRWELQILKRIKPTSLCLFCNILFWQFNNFRAVSEQFQDIFRAVSEQFQSNFRAVSEQFQGSFRAFSGQFQRSFKAILEQFQSSFKAVSEQFQSIFRAFSEQFQSIFRAFSRQFQQLID